MEIIDQIRQTANILEIAAQYTQLKQRGRRHVGLCPFHSEKTPSFYLDDDKQLYHCFGCGAGGDIFTLVMEKENLSFPEAVRFLAEKYNIEMPEHKALSPQMKSLKENVSKITADALAFFRRNLNNTAEGKKALEYLAKRKVSPETIRELKLGYAMNSWDSLLLFFKRKKVSQSLLEQAGLILRRQNKEGYYDRFRGRIIFPIFHDRTGKVLAFGGRSLFDEDPKYLNSPDTPIYSKGNMLYGLNFSRDDVKDQDRLILVEGYTDFISLYQAGIKHAAASLGTSLTPQQIDLVRRRYTSNIFTCYDGDQAGSKATLRAISLCFEQGAQVRAVLLPKGSDPDSYLTKNGGEAFLKLVQSSVSGLKFIVDFHTSGRRPENPEDKARVARDVLQEINKIPDTIVRSEYIKRTSEYLNIDEGEFRKSALKKTSAKTPTRDELRFVQAEKRLLQIIFEDTKIATYVFRHLHKADTRGLNSEPLWPLISIYLKKKKIPDMVELKQKIDPRLFEHFMRVLNEESEQAPTTDEADDLIKTLRKMNYQRERQLLSREMLKHQKAGQQEKVFQLQKKDLEFAKKLVELSQ